MLILELYSKTKDSMNYHIRDFFNLKVNDDWKSNYTYYERYLSLGVDGHIIKNVHSGNIRIMDVGCSKGTAMAKCIQELSSQNISAYCIGIDMNKQICQEAIKRLECVVNKRITDVDDYNGTMDFVVCMNVVTRVTDEVKIKIIRKCAEKLKPHGRLIINKNILSNTDIQNCQNVDMTFRRRIKMPWYKERKLREGYPKNQAVSIDKACAIRLSQEL